MITCLICNREFESYLSLSIHLKTHTITSADYFEKYLKTDTDGFCLTCGKPTKYQKLSKGYAKFCNSKCANRHPLVRNKISTTNLERYGVDVPAKNKEVLKKIQDTTFERLGVNRAAQNKEIKEKTKQTCLDRYGVDVPSKNPEIKKRMIRNSNRAMYSKLLSSDRLNNLVIPNFDIDEFIGCDHKHFWTCVKCGNIFDDHLQDGKIPRCYNCYPRKPSPVKSNAELEIIDFIKSLGIISISGSRSIIPPLEIDIYIPYHKIAIEYNGLYWHNEIGKGKNYHLNKTELCEKQDIQLLHIFEDEWLNKKDLVKSMIKSKLGLCNRIFARKTTVKQVSYTDSKDFLDNNHIQGSCQASIKLGLYSKDELVALMTFGKPRYNKSYEYELLRYAVKQDYSIIGGFSKLLKHFEIDYKPTNILSYADRRYSTGDVYTKNDFKLIHKTKPGFTYTDNFNRYNRMMFQNHKLKNKLEKYDPNLSVVQNMLLNGYNRIYDCGNLVYIKTF